MPSGDIRSFASFTIVASFLVFIFFSGLTQKYAALPSITSESQSIGPGNSFPDFSNYVRVSKLSAKEFPNKQEDGRVIIIGDVHGMYDSMQKLLKELSYDPAHDTFIHVGDLVAKGTQTGSIKVLEFMTSNNISGVRGNHDQKVIEWRAWMDWIETLPGGRSWLKELVATSSISSDDAKATPVYDIDEVEVSGTSEVDASRRPWWQKIPDGWSVESDHFQVAHAMTSAQSKYLRSLPLVLHAPHAHAFLVHAGVLPHDPHYSATNRRQPLAHPPISVDIEKSHDAHGSLRQVQEEMVLSEVKPNTDPWVTLNMRGVLKDASVTRGKDGTPWSDIWNEDIQRCRGFDTNLTPTDDRGVDVSKRQSLPSLPCHPFTVIYGHAAGRGLDIKRWSMGLDSGCVYKRRLSALVLGGVYAQSQRRKSSNFMGDPVVSFGDDGRGEIVSVECP